MGERFYVPTKEIYNQRQFKQGQCLPMYVLNGRDGCSKLATYSVPASRGTSFGLLQLTRTHLGDGWFMAQEEKGV